MWVTDEEKAQLKEAAKKYGFPSVTEFVKAVAAGAVKVSPHVKTLALAAIGTQSSGGCGPLFCLLLLVGVVAIMLF